MPGRYPRPEVVDPVTAEIETWMQRRGLSRTTAQQLAGIDDKTWRRRVTDGSWRTGDLAKLAPVLRVRVETLAGVA
jgi:hypothetical protein